jgi:hypothetical protein
MKYGRNSTTEKSVLFLHQLDELTSQGCSTPSCVHQHSDELFLTPRCHPGVGVRVGITDDVADLPCDAVLQLCCWQCHAEIVQVAITRPTSDLGTCAHQSALDVAYRAGRLTASCRRCHVLYFRAPVAAYVPV